jgi:hypothetical protein
MDMWEVKKLNKSNEKTQWEALLMDPIKEEKKIAGIEDKVKEILYSDYKKN